MFEELYPSRRHFFLIIHVKENNLALEGNIFAPQRQSKTLPQDAKGEKNLELLNK